MRYAEGTKRLEGFRKAITSIRRKMRTVQAALEPEQVADYALAGAKGEVMLSELFGDKNELIVIHNMGRSCVYCTLWADGYNGVYDHLADRAAFAVSSPDAPAVQKKFAKSRGWRFPMVSHKGTRFAKDLGYGSEEKGWVPGVSVFRRKGKKILRVSDTACGPGDDFSAVWHFFDLLPEGPGAWSPKYKYPRRR
ncbi:MAG: DUF899 domain-containing protein [Alphaproteobacteria bacterium]|nr:DUF899 domain-containing protein [Alphaproteobacteria bacterium]